MKSSQSINSTGSFLPACLPASLPLWFTAGASSGLNSITNDVKRIDKKETVYAYNDHREEKEREWHKTRKRMYVKRPVSSSY